MKVKVLPLHKLLILADSIDRRMNDVIMEFEELYWFSSFEELMPEDRVLNVALIENGLYFIKNPQFSNKYISDKMFVVV